VMSPPVDGDDPRSSEFSTLDNASSRAFDVFEPVTTLWSASHEQRARRAATDFLLSLEAPTAKAYCADLRSWLMWCRTTNVAPLHSTKSLIERYGKHLLDEQGLAPSTVARRLTAISRFFRSADQGGLLPGPNPAISIHRPKVPQVSEVLGLDRDELAALLGAAQRHSDRALLMVCLGALNGLRVSEYLGADVNDQRTIRGRRALRVRRKGGSITLVPLADVTVAALDAYLAGRTTGPLILSRTGRRLDRSNSARLLRRVATGVLPAATVAALRNHSLRHSHVGIGLDAGIPIDALQRSAGHASPVTTMIYDRAREAVSDNHPTHALADFVLGRH
jgi:integrase/recombinase XerD